MFKNMMVCSIVCMNIRLAKLDDAETIAQQNILLAKESEHTILDPKLALVGVKNLLLDKNKGFYLVAEQDGKIIGQIMITFEWSDWKNTMMWWIQSVYVQKNWRKKGVFSKLLKYIENMAREQKIIILRLYVHAKNTKAMQVYEKIGMKKQPYSIYQLDQ
jgi:GNAT superfamily N-acetyltransferase